jgi:Zn-dependent M28 family amino/carboxypeptidase
MTRHSLRLLAVVICSAIVTAAVQQPLVPPEVRAAAERITTRHLKADLEFLASDELKGRNTPSPGFDAAAEYIEARLRTAGVKPLGDEGSYRQHYVMRETTLDGGRASVRIGERTFVPGEDFALQAFAGDLSTLAPVPAVYVGHGWVADGVDPYREIDVKGKVVVVHAQSARPKGVTIRQLGRVTIGGTSPIVEARRRGAIAVVYLSSADTQVDGRPGQVVRRELDPPIPSAYAAPLVTTIRLRAAATRALLEGTALDADSLDERLNTQDYPASFELPTKVSIALPAATITHRPFNVVAVVEGTDPALKNEYIVVETHLDGAVGTRTVDGDGVYNSADDNASGSAAGLAMAEQMVRTPARRSVIFLWDSGEERGLWGTRRFVGQPPVPLDRIVALVNVDMIGANRAPGLADEREDRVTGPNEVFLIGPATLSDRVNTLIERVNDEYLDLSLNRRYDTPESEFFYPRTDAGPFLERGILTIGFTTGIHRRYHLPADEVRYLDPEKMTAIARTVFVTVHALGRSDERPRIEKPIPPTVLRVGEGSAAHRSDVRSTGRRTRAGASGAGSPRGARTGAWSPGQAPRSAGG